MTNRLELERIAAALQKTRDIKKFRQFEFYRPYDKQAMFHLMGAHLAERMLFAGNQLGKTLSGAAECAYHMTGEYPDWWEGRRFSKPVRCWISGKTAEVVRDTVQKLLCGPPGIEEEKGSGFIPRDAIIDTPLGRSVTAGFALVTVRHATGGVSVATFKSYDQGREKWQGESLDFIWYDEEPPMDIYNEGIARISATKGMAYGTFTPLKGRTEVVNRFLNEEAPGRGYVTMTIDDVGHFSPKERAEIIARYTPYEREARARGIPMMGEGRVFEATEEGISCDAIQVPPHWAQLWGIDFGIAHPFAACLMAWDKDTDTIYVTHCFKMSDARPLEHVAAMKGAGALIPVAWPQDGTAREKGSGHPLADIYKKHGAKMLAGHATHADGSISTEAGIAEMAERMATGRFKVFRHLTLWFEEYRRYHRKDGQIVKEFDDLLSATRIAVMARRFAKPPTYLAEKREAQVAKDVDFDVFA